MSAIRNFARSLLLPLGLLFAHSTMVQGQETTEDLPSVRDLMREHEAANGGFQNLNSVKTVRASGELELPNGTIFEFKLYRKAPSLMRMQFDVGSAIQITLFDGEQAVRWLEPKTYQADYNRSANFEVLTGAELANTRTTSHVEGPFFRQRNDLRSLTVAGIEMVNGRPAYKLEILKPESALQAIWIDVENFQEVKTQRLNAKDDGTNETVISLFSDFEKVEGIDVAQKVEFFKNGELDYTISIDRVAINVGIFDDFFAVPDFSSDL